MLVPARLKKRRAFNQIVEPPYFSGIKIMFMAKCPYCESTEFSMQKIEVANEKHGKTTVSVLVCKQCDKILSVMDCALDSAKPLPSGAFVKG